MLHSAVFSCISGTPKLGHFAQLHRTPPLIPLTLSDGSVDAFLNAWRIDTRPLTWTLVLAIENASKSARKMFTTGTTIMQNLWSRGQMTAMPAWIV